MPDAFFPRTPGLLGAIFEESSRNERAMREALFLTFNVDLGFFEDRLLGPVRATGAAVTVVADASVFAPDPRSVRSAGRTYALGLAHHSGAFHPKLSILVGPQRALIGVGSGNLTIGGWHANDEVLTTIRASREEGTPQIVGEIVSFLRVLPDVVTVGPVAAAGIKRTADALQALVDASDVMATPHRLAHSLAGPIMRQLPDGPVDRLELAAPFHDEGGRALSELTARYRPDHITVLAQPGRAVMQPDVLGLAAGTATLSYVQINGDDDTSTPYRHGKVLTATDENGAIRWSLTGSPNLTAAALLRSAADRAAPGNCELGVITAATASLLPTPTIEVSDVSALQHSITTDAEADDTVAAATVAVSEARLMAGGLLVVLSRPAYVDTAVFVSHFRNSPEQLEPLGPIPAGIVEHSFLGSFEAGTRVHVGQSVQFVIDPNLVQERVRSASSGSTNSNLTHAELFASPALAAQWEKTLNDLVLSHREPTTPTAISTTSPADGAERQRQRGEWRTLEDDAGWNEYLGDARNALGLPMFLLAAGPAATAAVGAGLKNAAPAWEDRFDDTADVFEEGETAEIVEADVDEAPGVVITPPPMTASQRQYYRRWFSQLAGVTGELGPVEAIGAVQLVIVGAGAQCWDGERGPGGWFDTLRQAAGHLVRDDWPSPLREQAASVFALGLYLLQRATPTDGRAPEAKAVRALAKSASDLLGHVSEERIDDNLLLLEGTQILTPRARDIVDEVIDLIGDSPAVTLLSNLGRAYPDFDCQWAADRQLHVRGSTSNPVQAAARVLAVADGFESLAVMVEDPRGRWAVVALANGTLTLISHKQGSTTYTTHKLRPLMTPLSLLTDSEALQRTRVSSPPFNVPGVVELEVLKQAPADALPVPEAVRARLV